MIGFPIGFPIFATLCDRCGALFSTAYWPEQCLCPACRPPAPIAVVVGAA